MEKKKSASHLARWFQFVSRHKIKMLAAFVLMLVGMAAEILVPKVVGFIIDDLLVSQALSLGRVILPVIGSIELKRALGILLLFLLAVLGIGAVSTYARNMLLCRVGEMVHLDIRSALFKHMQKLPLTFFDSNYTGRIMARITTDCDALWHLVFDGTNNLLAPSIKILVVLGILFHMHPGLTFCSLVVLPVFALYYRRTRKTAMKTGEQQRDALALIYSRLQERISGIRLIRAFGREQVENESFGKEMRGLFDHNMALIGSYTGLNAKISFLSGGASITILCLGGIAVTRNTISIGELVSFYLYIGMMFGPLTQLTSSAAKVFSDAHVAMKRIFAFLDTPISQELQGTKDPCPKLRGGLRIENLSFSYNEQEEPVLKNISITAKEGETIAIVGPSGSGKTTLVNLICRFYSPSMGKIMADDQDVTQFDAESYRRQISYVSQDTFLFSGSIADNIRFGRMDATDDQIEAAAKRANAHGFIQLLPQGYQTDVGERGVRLSGGQKQRLNIARALLRDPAILILDEPTSALDAETESIILEALKTVFKNRTCIIIAHRLSTVMNADTIFVIQDGKLAAAGNHKTLIEQDGLYQELCRKQFIGFGGSDDPSEHRIETRSGQAACSDDE